MKASLPDLVRQAEPIYRSQPGRCMRVAVFGSGAGSNLEALLASQEQGGYCVSLVLTDRDCGCEEIASREGLPSVNHSFKQFFAGKNPKDSAARYAYDQKFLEHIRAFEKEEGCPIDIVVLAGYMRLVFPPILKAFPNRVLNVHPGDLAATDSHGRRIYIGMDAVERALQNGERRTRSSVLLVDASVDGGPVLTSGPWVPYGGAHPPTQGDVAAHQEKQKKLSDWPALTHAVELIASGRFAVDRDGNIYLDGRRLGPSGCES